MLCPQASHHAWLAWLALPLSGVTASSSFLGPSSAFLCPQQGPDSHLVVATVTQMLACTSSTPGHRHSFGLPHPSVPMSYTGHHFASPEVPPHSSGLLVHFHFSPDLAVCPSVSAFITLVLYVPSPRPGSQRQQKPSLWAGVKRTQVAQASSGACGHWLGVLAEAELGTTQPV